MKNYKTSIFIKLILIIILAILLTHLVVFVFSFTIIRNSYINFIKQYGYFINDSLITLVKSISLNPDIKELNDISKKMNIKIRYKKENLKLATSEDIPDIEYLLTKTSPQFKDIKIGKYKRNFFLIIERQKDSFAFVFPRAPVDINPFYFIYILFAMCLIFIISYLILRKIMQPLKYLMKGVKEIQIANFDYQVPSKTRDQFGDLINSFNSMTRLIKQNLKAKDQLLLDVSHELRSPMMRMNVALEFVKDKEIQKSLKIDLKEMEAMVTEILEVERLKSGHGKIKFKNVDVVRLLKSFRENYNTKSSKIVLSALPENKFLYIDEDRIKIVFKNIIENAIRYSKKNKDPIIITINDDNDTVLINIQDSGIGISEKDIPYIFEPFYRVDSSRSKITGGYGLGMYLCKKIMEAHQGDITIKSYINKGTVVSLKFKKYPFKANQANINH